MAPWYLGSLKIYGVEGSVSQSIYEFLSETWSIDFMCCCRILTTTREFLAMDRGYATMDPGSWTMLLREGNK